MQLKSKKTSTLLMVFAMILVVLTTGCSKRSKLSFGEYELQRTIDNDSVRFDLSVSVDFPKQNSKGAVADSIRLFLSRNLFSIEQPGDPDALLKQYADTVLANYCAEMRDFRRVAGFTDPFKEEIVGTANELSSELLTYDKAMYVYYGGAQGQRRFESFVFSLVDGKRLMEGDIFLDEQMEALTTLLTEALKTQIQGEIEHEVIPNNNFTVIPEGILYRYDGYELNTFDIPAVESVDLLVEKDKVLPLIRPESPVYKYLSTVVVEEEK